MSYIVMELTCSDILADELMGGAILKSPGTQISDPVCHAALNYPILVYALNALTKGIASVGTIKDLRRYWFQIAACLGYSLYHQLTQCGVDCVILAPITMHQENG